MVVSSIKQLSRLFRAKSEEGKTFRSLQEQALNTRIAVSRCLESLVGVENETVRKQVRQEIEDLEEKFRTEAGQFLNKLSQMEIEYDGVLDYNEICNSVV